MSETASSPKFNRRALILGAVFLAGGAAALTRLRNGSRGDGAGQVLTAAQFAMLELVSDIIIPATDTPGAIAAGVPQYIREMLANWAAPQTLTEFAAMLDLIDQRAWGRFGAGFLELAHERRFELMRDFDAEMVTSGDKNYRRLKFLVLVGYYHSEVGATQELRFELVPGAWRACVPLSEIGRASPV